MKMFQKMKIRKTSNRTFGGGKLFKVGGYWGIRWAKFYWRREDLKAICRSIGHRLLVDLLTGSVLTYIVHSGY